MFDIFDVMAFAVFAVLLAVGVILVVVLGSLPGWVAQKRGHPQAAAINVASWLGLATLGLFWPFALIWAFLNPRAAVPSGSAPTAEPPAGASPDADAKLAAVTSRLS
jgi:hypothetical protein